jgi:hypothetical protein
MIGRKIPMSIKERLRRKLEKRLGGGIAFVGRSRLFESLRERIRRRVRAMLVERRGDLRERFRSRLRRRLLSEEVLGNGIRDRVRSRLRRRLLEGRIGVGDSLRDRVRSRVRKRFLEEEESLRDRVRSRVRKRLLEEFGSGLRYRIRERLLGKGDDLKEVLRRRIRQRLMERRVGSERVGGLRLRRRLVEAVDEDDVKGRIRERIRERIRQRMLEGREVMKSVGSVPMLGVMRGEVGLGERGLARLRRSELRERLLRLSGVRSSGRDIVSERKERVEAFLRRRVERLEEEVGRLERELRRKTRLLKEAYKVVRRVEELGGIDKVEEAMRLAYDTIVKAGSKLFKEAVEGLARETGVNKKEVATVVKKVGLKEAREILKGGKRGKAETKTVIVEGMGERDEQFPVLAIRMAERLSKQVEVGNPSDMKDLGKAIFTKGV